MSATTRMGQYRPTSKSPRKSERKQAVNRKRERAAKYAIQGRKAGGPIAMLTTNGYDRDARTMSARELAQFYDQVDTFDADARETTIPYLSAYALACGYQEIVQVGHVSVSLWAEGCYHVRAHDHAPDADHGVSHVAGRLFWHTFDGPTALDDRYRDPAVIVRPHTARMTGAAWFVVEVDGCQVGNPYDDQDDAGDAAALATARKYLRETVDTLEAGNMPAPVAATD